MVDNVITLMAIMCEIEDDQEGKADNNEHKVKCANKHEKLWIRLICLKIGN